jgi:phosphate starvation-inducible PhoH-like protein
MSSQDLVLLPDENDRLVNFCGQYDEHLRHLEKRLGITIANRGNHFQLSGDESILNSCGELMQALYALTEKDYITPEMVHLALQEAGIEVVLESEPPVIAPVVIKTKHGLIKGRGANQKGYLQQIMSHDINFGIGPAGTGKTYLAVACAVHALQTEQVRKIILVRPAVEAGEKLGFLPGDMAQKVDPYLRPLYDALHEMLGLERVEKLIEKGVIEVAPLAFMRGRTLNNAFIILDEAQNTTLEQIKMFLTRLGFGSTAVITGDITQIDLPNEKMSGLRHVMNILQKVDGISFTFFTVRDVVRHPLVQRIVEAYESFEKEQNEKPLP